MIITIIEISLGCQLNHSNAKIGVVDVEVIGDAPHDDEVHPLLLKLPCQCARGSRKTEKYQLKILISLQTFNSNASGAKWFDLLIEVKLAVVHMFFFNQPTCSFRCFGS